MVVKLPKSPFYIHFTADLRSSLGTITSGLPTFGDAKSMLSLWQDLFTPVEKFRIADDKSA
jgi:hypothetical protein